MRKLILEAAPDVVETWKWIGTPVWEHNGTVCTGESYKGDDVDAVALKALIREAVALNSAPKVKPTQKAKAG